MYCTVFNPASQKTRTPLTGTLEHQILSTQLYYSLVAPFGSNKVFDGSNFL